MLLGRDARERLEPVRVVRGPAGNSPFLHGVRHDVCHVHVERLALVDRGAQLGVHVLRQIGLHGFIREDHRAEPFLESRHASSFPAAVPLESCERRRVNGAPWSTRCVRFDQKVRTALFLARCAAVSPAQQSREQHDSVWFPLRHGSITAELHVIGACSSRAFYGKWRFFRPCASRPISTHSKTPAQSIAVLPPTPNVPKEPPFPEKRIHRRTALRQPAPTNFFGYSNTFRKPPSRPGSPCGVSAGQSVA